MNGTRQATVIEGLESQTLDAPGLRIFKSPTQRDQRGWVMPTYSEPYFSDLGIPTKLLHENHCWSEKAGTIRGFHYQLPPYGQSKLIRVCRGCIYDVNLDLRKGSPTFGQTFAVELSEDGWNQIYVPSGFAHCYCTRSDGAEVLFKLGALFAPSHARGIAWNDPDLAIDWPVAKDQAIVLERDLDRPRFSAITEFFPYPAE